MVRMADLLVLVKIKISLLAALMSVLGLLLAGGHSVPVVIQIFAGFLFFSGGASVVNHIQDRDLDRRMARTRSRPVSSGRWSVTSAMVLALFCFLGGTALLGNGLAPSILVLACGSVVAYNGLYAWLRPRTWAATFVGALSGVFPLAAGWYAGGGSLAEPIFLAVAALAYGWQIPHFWLLSLGFGHEYGAAGLPTPATRFGREQVGRIAFSWILGLAGLSLCLPLFGLLRVGSLTVVLFAISVLLVLKALPLLHSGVRAERALSAFRYLTAYILAVVGMLAADSLLTPVRF